jgi:CubicO group peptidase (beta-lactamase class C family)
MFHKQSLNPGARRVARPAFRFMEKTLFLVLTTIALAADAAVFPGATWETKSPADVGMDAAKLEQARDYALTGGGSGYIVRSGRLIMAWGSSTQLYDLKSSTKAIGVTALGLAIKDGKMRLPDKAAQHHPQFGIPPESNAQTGWLDKITLWHLAAQTAGFEKPGGYTNLLFEPGTKWHYSDGGPNWLAECITLVYGQDMNTLLFDRVFTRLGIKASDLRWRENAYRPHSINGIKRREFGSGIHANVDAMARIGYLYLREGRWKEEEILPKEFIEVVRRPPAANIGLPEYDPKAHGNASDHYGLLWWNNADGALPEVPRDAFWSWGLYDSLTVVIPSLDIVVARAGASWKRNGDGHYEVLMPFLAPIAASLRSQKQDAAAAPSRTVTAPYPGSTFIKEIVWAPKETIIRAAKGSDNWPLTWADDDNLYGAYGDGNGFEPRVPEKLSLGFAKVAGSPGAFAGFNPGTDARFKGGFSIYDAPEPWGPWTTVYSTEDWDVGPGESSSFPTKWMSSDGKTIHLVFSGDDCFSVRKATLF